MGHIILIDTDSVIVTHDGCTEWSDCAECGRHIDPAVVDLGDEWDGWDGACPHCGAPKERVGLRLDTGDIRRTCACGVRGYLAATEDGEVEHQGRLYQMPASLAAGEPMLAGTDGVARCAAARRSSPPPCRALADRRRGPVLTGEPEMARKLKCETETKAMERRIRGSFRSWSRHRSFCSHFEHGQWWIIDSDTANREGRTYSVVDATGGDSVDGFGFEEV